METVVKDILSVKLGFILHQVNCQSIADTELALRIAHKWPEWKVEFDKSGLTSLGKANLFRVNENLCIVNLHAQLEASGVFRETNYAALGSALLSARRKILRINRYPLTFIPHRIGCEFGGSSWSVVKLIIRDAFPDAIICKKPERRSE